MGERTLLRGALLLHTDRSAVEQADVLVEGGIIREVGAGLPATSADQVVELAGRWLMPGLVCTHHHLYSALSCGMPMPSEAPTDFADMLAKVWWKLDRALDPESVAVSGLVGGVQALRAGVTTLVDHHASPNFIVGSLEALDEALAICGVRRVLCYEVTDRGGPEQAQAGLDAHKALLASDGQGMRAVLIGAHANFTVGDDTLRACGQLAREGKTGLHIHVAEAVDDEQSTGEPLIARMERLGALVPGSLLAHCVHLSADELARVADAGAWVTHQPRSNMNNGVGYAPLADFPANTALGTDGIGADMLAEVQTGWYRAAEAGVGWSPARWLEVLSAGARFAGPRLGVELGRIAPGAAADLVVLDRIPGPRLSGANLPAAAIFRLTAAAVRDVMVAGQWQLWDRKPTGLDTDDLDARAQRIASDVWRRMEQAG